MKGENAVAIASYRLVATTAMPPGLTTRMSSGRCGGRLGLTVRRSTACPVMLRPHSQCVGGRLYAASLVCCF
jgi:hypothetical protein